MTEELHSLIGAYVLDALPPEEVAAFREHLARCDTCRAEESELRAAAARLGERTRVEPGPDLRRRVLAAVDRTPQLPPIVKRPSHGGWLGMRLRPTLLVAAATLAVVALGVMFGLGGHSGQTTTLAADVAQVFSASDAQVEQVSAVQDGALRVAVSRQLGAVAIDTSGLDPLATDKSYQLWLVTDGTPASAGVLTDLSTGKRLALPANGVLVAVTVEPHGGSTQPTTAPIAVFNPGELVTG